MVGIRFKVDGRILNHLFTIWMSTSNSWLCFLKNGLMIAFCFLGNRRGLFLLRIITNLFIFMSFLMMILICSKNTHRIYRRMHTLDQNSKLLAFLYSLNHLHFYPKKIVCQNKWRPKKRAHQEQCEVNKFPFSFSGNFFNKKTKLSLLS